MLPFLIRRAEQRDADGILCCLRLAFEPFRHLYSPEAYADTTLTPATIRTRLASMSVYVALTESETIGTVGSQVIESGHGHVRGMAVLAEWQGHGVAEKLLIATEDELRTANCAIVTLDTTAPLKR